MALLGTVLEFYAGLGLFPPMEGRPSQQEVRFHSPERWDLRKSPAQHRQPTCSVRLHAHSKSAMLAGLIELRVSEMTIATYPGAAPGQDSFFV